MTERSALRRLVDLGVQPDMTVTNAKHVRITNIVSVLTAAMVLPWAPFNVLSGQLLPAVENAVVGLLLLSVLLVNHRGHHAVASMLLLIAGQAQMAWAVWVFGVGTGILLYYVLVIFLPYVVLPTRYRLAAHGFAVLGVVTMVTFTALGDSFPPLELMLELHQQVLVNTIVVAGGLLIMAAAFRSLVDETEAALEREQARADTLLLNVLPESIAERLKDEPDRAIADRFGEVTVLFADIVGFTPLSARLSAERTVELLNEIFTAFDAICDRAGVEKVRTIGDGYMAVAGAPNLRADHAQVMTRVAIEMREYMARRTGDEALQVRIGVNTGEAVAGIVGTARFHYDLWGDAVNVAARMESTGEPGHIQVARATWERIRDAFPCESRGTIAVKGKGEMETWFVGGASPRPA